MAELQTLARPYAKAVFEHGRDHNTLPAWASELAALSAVVEEPTVAAMIDAPSVGRVALGDAIVSAMGATLSVSGASLVRLLVENRRLVLAPVIAEQFMDLKNEFESTVDVSITTATPVSAAQQTELSSAIGKRLDRKLQIDWSVDESLLAGAIVRAGDLVIDGSMSGELDRLKSSLAR